MNIEQVIKDYKGDKLYPVGFTFTDSRGKQTPRQKTVLNYEISFNLAGNVTDFKYILGYDFLGQRMTEKAIQTTLDRCTNNGWKEINHD